MQRNVLNVTSYVQAKYSIDNFFEKFAREIFSLLLLCYSWLIKNIQIGCHGQNYIEFTKTYS